MKLLTAILGFYLSGYALDSGHITYAAWFYLAAVALAISWFFDQDGNGKGPGGYSF